MHLVSFSVSGGKPRPGALIEDTGLIADLTAAGHADALAAIAAGVTAVDKPGAYPGYRLSEVRLHAPLANPPRIFAIGLNYRDHAVESKMALPAAPVVFFKLTPSIVGPGDAIVLPKNSSEPDYEAELAFVIGKGGFRIPIGFLGRVTDRQQLWQLVEHAVRTALLRQSGEEPTPGVIVPPVAT